MKLPATDVPEAAMQIDSCRRQAVVHTMLMVTLLLTVACSAPPAKPESTHEFVVTEENGVTVARSTGGPKYQGEIFTYEKVLEIRPDESRPETLFYLIAEMAIDDGGNLYVVDNNGNRISVFDPTGKWLRDIGRQGDGPGEFQYPVRVDYLDGQVRIPDRRKRGTHVFTPSGEFVTFERWPDFPRRGELSPQVWSTPDGGSVVYTRATNWIVDRLEGNPGQDVVRERTEMLLFNAAGREVARVDGPWINTGEWRTIADGGREARWEVPIYFASSSWGGHATSLGVWLSPGDAPRVEWYDLEGKLVRRFEIELPPTPVTEEDRELIRELLRQQARELANPTAGEPNPRAIARARLLADTPLFADAKPHWGAPMVDTEGFMWLPSRTRTGGPVEQALAERAGNEMFFRIINPQGEYLGDTSTPALGYIERSHLLAIEEDVETEERFPVVYRIRPAVEGFEYGGQ